VGLLVTLLAVVVRLAWVRLVPTRPVGDFAMYVESARYLVEHRSFDPEFIYMPGYVGLVAAVDALGGGLFAIKMIGVAAGGLTTAATYGTTRAVFGRGAAIAAGLACALWPAGVAAASVTGTDMPGAALLATAVWLLVRNAGERPLGAPVLYGFALGLAALVRAVALPLVAFAVLHFRARGALWVHAITRTVAAGVVTFLVLLPWGVRNRRASGEFTLTDSHGGHTALVGANPNSEGTYSRSLNRLYTEGTGYKLGAPPVRDADRAAYALAKQWTRVEPPYAAGLLAAKADRLLSHERPLLYWPIYRQSVLPEGSPSAAWFSRHRALIENIVDGYWYALVAAFLIGVAAAAGRRNFIALSLAPMPLALAALYTLFFAEARYHLAIVALAMPFVGAGLVWVGEAIHDLARRVIDRQRRPRLVLEAVVSALAIAIVFLGWPRMVAAGGRLRERHRWAACVCTIAGAKRVCAFVPTAPAPPAGPSPVRGVWDGFGLRLSPSSPRVAAATDVDLPGGRYRISMRAEAAGPAPDGAAIELRAGGAPIGGAGWPPAGTAITVGGSTTHAGGKLHIEVAATGSILRPGDDVPSLWLSTIQVETDPH
jgi:4-amino-4-deoxy-L-arabinose transferase-like glycosyltransferase